MSENLKAAANTREDRVESAKNPFVPGARILRKADARQAYVNGSASMHRFYPLSEVNDLGLFSHIEKREITDKDRPWAVQAHPDVNLYTMITRGSGRIVFGAGDETFEEETYDFAEGDLVIVPRGVPYRYTGEWEGIAFHARMSVFGKPAGVPRYPHPVVAYEKPNRPTAEERDALQAPGTLVCLDPTGSRGVTGPSPMTAMTVAAELDLGKLRPDLAPIVNAVTPNERYEAVTPIDEQTFDRGSVLQAKKNPTVLGARVLRKTLDAPDVYNANAGNKQWAYPMGWTDDLAICIGATHSSISDADRPFDSHSHPDIEEYKYILSGSGTVTLGIADETFETERYAFGEGDLVLLPRGVPHVDAGDYTALYFHTKASVFGKVPGTSQYPHIAYVYDKPARPTQEERDALNDPGTYILMDSRETYNIYLPNPILRVEKNATGMKHLRPDLFPEERE